MPRVRRSVLLGLPACTFACWSGGLTPELCCVGPGGNSACWDAEFTFERCCSPEGPPKASEGVEIGRFKPASVQSLPLLGGGSMPMAGMGLCCRSSAQGDAVRQGVLDFLLMGGRLLDDAHIYNNHREVGLGVRQALELGVPRSEVFLTTKISPQSYSFEVATEWVSQALQELGLEYIDLVLLHWAGVKEGAVCGSPKACRQETWLALQRAKTKGLIRHLGVSNFGPRQMEELRALGGEPIEVNQLEYHPWAPLVHRETVEWCHQHQIAVTAYGSMGSSRNAQEMMMQGALLAMGMRHNKTPGQVLLRWAIQKNVSVIPGTSNPKHLAENLDLFDFSLDPNEVATLDGVPETDRMLHFNHWPDKSP